jgi:7-alpha-hydroxysteroid dehydrogenase
MAQLSSTPADAGSDFRLDGQVAIVTGAGRGIGRACALAFAAAGADVACAARTMDELTKLCDDIRALGRTAIAVRCDVAKEEDLQRLVAETQRELGRITTLVNNAGGSGPNDALQTSGAEFARVLTWNVAPAFMLSALVVPPMRKAGGGSIINISSAAARYVQRHFSAYGAAKAALSHLTRNLAQDFAPEVRVNAIEPGPILTAALEPYLTPDRRAAMIARTPLRSLGEPADVANAALFLASRASRWITGKVIELDGGATSTTWS